MPVVTQTLEHVHITFPCPCSLSCIQIKSLTGRRWWIQSHSRRRKFCHYGFLRLLTFSVLASCTSGNSKTFCWALILKCPPQSCWCCTFRPLGMLAAHWPSFFHWGKFKAAPPPSATRFFMPGGYGHGRLWQPSARPGDATGRRNTISACLCNRLGTDYPLCSMLTLKNPHVFIRK